MQHTEAHDEPDGAKPLQIIKCKLIGRINAAFPVWKADKSQILNVRVSEVNPRAICYCCSSISKPFLCCFGVHTQYFAANVVMFFE